MSGLIRWNQDPFRDFDDMFTIMNSLMSSPIRSGVQKFGFDMAVDMYEDGKYIKVEMSLPGIDPEQVEVSAEDGYLKISGSREEVEEENDKKRNYYSKEIRRGSFERVVKLPTQVEADKAEAEYLNGVLTVTVPKIAEEDKKKTIQVKKK